MATLLEALCRKRGLTQESLAEELSVSRAAVGKWIRGEASPHAPTALALAQRLEYDDDPANLFKAPEEPQQQTQEQAMEFLKKLDRRELFVLLASLPQLEGVDFSSLGTGSEPDEFLSQCHAAIDGCDELMRLGSMEAIDGILMQFLPKLSGLASNPSEFQEIAAPLMVQAKILQIRLATHKTDFINRKLLCLDAVKFGKLSGDSLTLTGALYWQSDTYIYCYRQPKKARAIIEEAIGKIDSNSQQDRSPLLANLSLAYAMDGDETNALIHASQARSAINEASIGHSDLDRSDGRMSLYLAERFPGKGYAKMAYDAFGRCLETPDTDSYLSQTHIHKANACLAMGKLDEYAACLENGMQIAMRINSKQLQDNATIAYGKAEIWKNERRYIDLGRLF